MEPLHRRLAKEEGIFAGYSAGSAIAAINQLKEQLNEMMWSLFCYMIMVVAM